MRAMKLPEISEDTVIRSILVLLPTFLVAGFLATALVVTVMISENFNFLNWME